MSDTLPKIGIGTSQNDEPEECAESIQIALEEGYQHVDTALAYGNEEYVGEGIERADVDDDDFILATKVPETKNAYDDVLASAEESLDNLGVDTIDMLYVHWPINEYSPEETLPAFNELYDEGKIEYAAVSNFSAKQTEEAIEHLDVPLVANQVEMHPLLPPREEHLESAREHGYQLVSYGPFCRGEAFGVDEVIEVAEKHDVSQARVILSWLTNHDNVVAIPKGSSRDHIVDNLEATSLELDDEDIELIDSIDEEYRRWEREDAYWKQ